MVNHDEVHEARRRQARRKRLGLIHTLSHQWFAALFLIICAWLALGAPGLLRGW